MEMRVLGGHLLTAGAETPYPVICRDPVGQPDLYQPFQVAIETDAIHPPPVSEASSRCWSSG